MVDYLAACPGCLYRARTGWSAWRAKGPPPRSRWCCRSSWTVARAWCGSVRAPRWW